MTGVRDRQRSKVYVWEERFVAPRDQSSIAFAQAQGMVDAIWTEMGLLFPPKVEPLPRQARSTVADANRLSIGLADASPSWWLLHELARRIKEGAIPIISDVPGFRAYYVIYAPDDTVTAISIFDDYAGAQESNRRGLAWIEQSLAPLLTGPATAVAGPVIAHTLA